MIPVEQIKAAPGWQTRSLGDLSGLEDSLKARGMNGVPPLTAIIDGDSVIVRQGHRRLQAALNVIASGVPLAGLRVIPEPKTSSEEDHIADIYLSNNGKNISVLETAILVKRFIDLGWSRLEIAEKLTLSESYVSRLEYLINIPKALSNAIDSELVSANTAINEIAAGRLDELLDKIKDIEELDSLEELEDSSQEEQKPGRKKTSSRKKPKLSGTAVSGKTTPAKAIKLLREQIVQHLDNDVVVIEMSREVYCQIFGPEE